MYIYPSGGRFLRNFFLYKTASRKNDAYHCCHVPIDPDIWIKVRKILGYINAIHSHTKVLEQGVDIAIQLQRNLPQERDFIRGIPELVVRPEVEGVVQAISDQCVVTVTLEVVFLAIKCDVVWVSPDLTITRCWKDVQNIKVKKILWYSPEFASIKDFRLGGFDYFE